MKTSYLMKMLYQETGIPVKAMTDQEEFKSMHACYDPEYKTVYLRKNNSMATCLHEYFHAIHHKFLEEHMMSVPVHTAEYIATGSVITLYKKLGWKLSMLEDNVHMIRAFQEHKALNNDDDMARLIITQLTKYALVRLRLIQQSV